MLTDSKDIIKKLEKTGWYLVRVRGDHHILSTNRIRELLYSPIRRKIRLLARYDQSIKWLDGIHQNNRCGYMYYLAVVHKEEFSCYGVSFPELPGCTASSDSLDEVIEKGQEAMHLYRYEVEEKPIPKGLDFVLQNSLEDGRLLVAAIPLRDTVQG